MKAVENFRPWRFHEIPYRWVPLLFIGLVASIITITWPWAKIFSTEVIAHWDPPFHAWKLEYAARQLLEGRLLPVDGNTNMYYPYSGAFYFEALHWPQAVLAAALFGLTNAEPVLVYHVVLVFFWALSGVCLWMLLRALGVSAFSAVLGALFFTLMPYRISYRVEFNMQLCFGIPLFFFFFVRYFQRPNIRYACGMAIAWWLQATSELYQAFFLVLILPFPILAMMSGRWSLAKSFKKFWLPILCALVLGGALTFIWLWPYTTILQSDTLTRGLQEIKRHVLEPLSYLVPSGQFGVFSAIKARRDEMSVYPTLLLIVLSAMYFVVRTKDQNHESISIGYTVLYWSRAAVLVLFMLITALIYHSIGNTSFVGIYSFLPVLFCFFSIPLMFTCKRHPPSTAFMSGLFAAAAFAFFLSLGPLILGTASGFSCKNVLYLWLYDSLEALRGFRVVSRFAVFVLFWMVLASAFTLDAVFYWANTRGKRVVAITGVSVLLVLFVTESIPKDYQRVMLLPCPLESEVLSALDMRSEPYVLAIVPMGKREIDSQHMLQVSRYNRLSVYAWGGTYPSYTWQVCQALVPNEKNPISYAVTLLRQLWPECMILEDKAFSRPHPFNINYTEELSDVTTVENEDARFVLLRIKPGTEPAVEHIKLIRHDYLVGHPQISFTAASSGKHSNGSVWLDLNGYFVGKWDISAEPQAFSLILPDALFSHYTPNRLRFHSGSESGFVLSDFKMQPAEIDVDLAPSDSDIVMPWQSKISELPSTAIPLDAEYPGGLRLFGVDVRDRTAEPKGAIRLRYYVKLPKSMRSLRRLSIKTGITQNGNVIFESGDNLLAHTDMFLFWTRKWNGMVMIDQTAIIPDSCVEGEEYGLAVTIKDSHDKRISGYTESGKKIRRLYLPDKISIK